MSSKNSEFYHIGLSLASNSSHNSSVCVIDKNKEIVLLDKLYFTDDIKLFFSTSSYIKNSITLVTLAPDESLLDGKWRIHSKNYKMLGDTFKVNKNNWTNRLTERLCDLFLDVSKHSLIYRCNINLLRREYGLAPDYLDKTSLDCKSFQAGLRIKYGFSSLPENLLPAASLEAVLSALFAYDIAQRNIKYQEISEFRGLKVINPA